MVFLLGTIIIIILLLIDYILFNKLNNLVVYPGFKQKILAKQADKKF